MIAQKYLDLREDLRAGMSIEDALEKNNCELSYAFRKLQYQQGALKRTTKKKNPTYSIGVEQYIQERRGHYYLRKSKKDRRRKTKGKYRSMTFGTYSSLEDAIKVREALKEDGWHQKHVDEICERLGIERVKGHPNSKERYS